MCTARLLTVSQHALHRGGCLRRGGVFARGGMLARRGGRSPPVDRQTRVRLRAVKILIMPTLYVLGKLELCQHCH